MSDWQQYARTLGDQARCAARILATVTGAQKRKWLEHAAGCLLARADELVAENARDLEQAPGYGLTAAAIDRLTLSRSRLDAMAAALREVSLLPDPVGQVLDGEIRPNGLSVSRVRVPLGVVFFIYESRPNVTLDAAALCIKSGNAVILRGGKEALHSNLALYRVLSDSLAAVGLPADAVQLVSTIDREVVGELLKLSDRIDVTIPRGGKSLIERVAAEARMPVIKHFDGVCHVYVDASADVEMAVRILRNAKCQRPGVCNAAECVLVHRGIAEQFWAAAGPVLQQEKVEVRGCVETVRLFSSARPASEVDYRTEYLDLILSAKVVDSLDAAMRHIEEYGSHHTESIVTNSQASAEKFLATVDSAAVIVNASTRFNDGGELGLGAEIGISTDKFHARGPCGLRELTSYKWIVRGSGQVRE